MFTDVSELLSASIIRAMMKQLQGATFLIFAAVRP
jgi:hypothetical protein